MRRRISAWAALLLAMTGLAVTTTSAPAQAGWANDSGQLAAAFYNVTPYTMTLVGYDSKHGWDQHPAATIQPGDAQAYYMRGSGILDGGICIGSWKNSYWGWITYRVDVLGAPPEYLTLGIAGDRTHSTSVGCGDFVPPNDTYPAVTLYNTTSMPVAGWDPASGQPPGPPTPTPQLTNEYNTPTLFDQTIGIEGNWTVDANTAIGYNLDPMLNQICGGSDYQITCDFTQTAPLTWGAGAPVLAGNGHNCAAPETEPDYVEVEYSTEQEVSLTIGGSVEASVEANILDIVKSKITVGLEADREWGLASGFTRDSKAYLPGQYQAEIWAAPTIGYVTGTLKLIVGSSTFTVTNFRQTRSGVTKDNMTPAYDAITAIRKMTADELQDNCTNIIPPAVAKPGTLKAGVGVGKLRLGRARDARVLGKPLRKAPQANRSPLANDCMVLDPRCSMVTGRGGSWVYADTTVVFDKDRSVSALIYSGRARTAKGVGVGSSLRKVRSAYPDASCVASSAATNCAVQGRGRSGPVQTVFHLTRKKGRTVVDRVMIYRVDTASAGWTA